MTQPSQIVINGPYEETADVPDDPFGDAEELKLYLTSEGRDSASTTTNRESIPFQEDEDSIMAALIGEREFSFEGVGNGIRLLQAGFGDKIDDEPNNGPSPDARDAIIQWLIELEYLVLSGQGRGYRLEDKVRGEVFSPERNADGELISRGILFDSVSWEAAGGEPLNAEYRLSGKVADGVGAIQNRRELTGEEINNRDPSISQDKLQTENGLEIPLGYVEKREFDRSIELNTMGILHNSNVPNVGLSNSGVESEFTVSGQITRNDVDGFTDVTLFEEVARLINDDIHGKQATIYDAFTKRTFSGSVSDSNTSFVAGRPDIFDYRIEIEIGQEAGNV